jgi:tetratricopeptide (TPR) repeat protein
MRLRLILRGETLRYQPILATQPKSQQKLKLLLSDVFSAVWLAFSTIAVITALAGAMPAQGTGAPSQSAQGPATLIATGQQQLQAARSANTEESYRAAEATFDRAVQLDAKDPIARSYLGLTRMELSGWFARKGSFGPSGELTTSACADLDAAVALGPDNIQVRLSRGASYAEFPSFLNKGALARGDLEVVVHHPKFAVQSNDLRARAHYTLGRVYAAGGESEKARASWQAAVAASPQSREGQAAQVELGKLAAPVVAADVMGRRMPDRFPKISLDTTPIIVSATVTFPNHRGDWKRESLPDSMKSFLAKLEKQPGLLGVHALSSIDNQGMLVILTWWENKKALNDWFYSETHRGIISQFYGSSQPASGPVGSTTPTGGMGQVGIELFTALPGGMVFGGGLTPARREKQ